MEGDNPRLRHLSSVSGGVSSLRRRLRRSPGEPRRHVASRPTEVLRGKGITALRSLVRAIDGRLDRNRKHDALIAMQPRS